MNNNIIVKSLVELLVKKAGFDLNKNYSEEELAKTKETIKELEIEKETSNNKKALNGIIDSLKVRQASWENNAEIVGKSILSAYSEGKGYNSVKARIELLVNLGNKGTQNLGVGSLYETINSLQTNLSELEDKVNTFDYKNNEEKEMDEKYKAYLANKIDSINNEIEKINAELENLRDVELKDVNIVNKIKEYIGKLENDLERINNVLTSSLNSNLSNENFNRLEKAKEELVEKINKCEDTLAKAEEMLDNVRKNRLNIGDRKNILELEFDRCNNKLNNVNIRLEEDNYVNQIDKIIDVNEIENIKFELENLNNKKDVLYVDVLKVKEELIKVWNSSDKSIIEQVIEEPVEETVSEEAEVEKIEVIEETEEQVEVEPVKEKAKSNKIELDW